VGAGSPARAEPTTIGEVIEALERLLAWSLETPSRVGYFVTLYLDVTQAIRQAMIDGVFDDPARIERLDVAFARRYLTAWEQFQSDKKPTGAWEFAFSTCGRWWPTVMQHLVIAANAHINLDLGVAVAEIVPAAELPAFHPDFEKVNQILSSLVPRVETGLGRIFPLLAMINAVFGLEERWLIDLEMAKVRAQAWNFAGQLAALDPSARGPLIAAQDSRTVKIAQFLRWPGFLVGTILGLVRLGERWTIRGKIEALRRCIQARRRKLQEKGLH
jgi:hypothetical protein